MVVTTTIVMWVQVMAGAAVMAKHAKCSTNSSISGWITVYEYKGTLWSAAVNHACKAQHYKIKQAGAKQKPHPIHPHNHSCSISMRVWSAWVTELQWHICFGSCTTKSPWVPVWRQFPKHCPIKDATCKPMWLLFTRCCMLVIRQFNFMNYVSAWTN